MKINKLSSGFTLIEVMIALSIFAVLAATVSRTASQNADTVLRLEDKTLASFVAENRLNAIKLERFSETVTQTSDSLKMAGREWHIVTKSSKTQIPGLNMIEVSVARSEDKESFLSTLTTLAGKY